MKQIHDEEVDKMPIYLTISDIIMLNIFHFAKLPI